MAYDEEQRRKSRVVVETPAARREVVETQVARVPERRGVSAGVVAALVIGAVALVTILFLFLMDRQQEADNTNVRVTTQPSPIPQTTIIQQPAPVQQPPVIVQQPPATTTTQPIIVTPPPPTSTTTTTTERASGTNDVTIQSNVDRRIADDPKLASLGVIATVVDGKVTLTGTVDTADLKRSVERAVKAVKGVRSVDNQVTVAGGAGTTPP